MSYTSQKIDNAIALTLVGIVITLGILCACAPEPYNPSKEVHQFKDGNPRKQPVIVCLDGVEYYEFDGPTITYAPRLVPPYAGASVPVTQVCK